MIVRTPERPIRNEDIEIGSLVTVKSPKDKPMEYMVINYKNRNKKVPVIKALRIVPAGSNQNYAYYLYAGKAVLLNSPSAIDITRIDTVRARLASDIVQSIVRKHMDCRQKIREQQRREHELAKAKQHTLYPGNDTWGSLKLASKGYIHIYRG